MTYEEYRGHMRRYSRDTIVMSFVVTNHNDFVALRQAGNEIIPWLLKDMLDPSWHCSHCYGEGFEFPPGWEWDAVLRNWPTDTGIPCTQCKGKGNVNSWACMTLLFEKAGDEAPVVEEWMRGRHAVLTKLWIKWGVEHGILPVQHVEIKKPAGAIKRLLQALGLLN